MQENSKSVNDLLKNVSPGTIEQIKRMASSGELDSIKGKLSGLNKNELMSALSKNGGDINALKGDPAFRAIANDPAMQAILNKLSGR